MDISDANKTTIDAYSGLTEEFYDRLGDDRGFARRALLNPAIFGLLGDVVGNQVLSTGCGHGYLCRLLAERGESMTAVEPANVAFQYAQRREHEPLLGIQYLPRDLSRLGDLNVAFDVVEASMVFLDIPDWRSALANCIAALRAGRDARVLAAPSVLGTRERRGLGGGGAPVEISEYLNEYGLVQTPHFHLAFVT